jgi:hypothetical protein
MSLLLDNHIGSANGSVFWVEAMLDLLALIKQRHIKYDPFDQPLHDVVVRSGPIKKLKR